MVVSTGVLLKQRGRGRLLQQLWRAGRKKMEEGGSVVVGMKIVEREGWKRDGLFSLKGREGKGKVAMRQGPSVRRALSGLVWLWQCGGGLFSVH